MYTRNMSPTNYPFGLYTPIALISPTSKIVNQLLDLGFRCYLSGPPINTFFLNV